MALVAIAVHVTLMFVAFWDDVVSEFHTGEYVYSVYMPIGCLVVGYVVCRVLGGGARGMGRRLLLPAALRTAQKGSQALICSLIFAMGKYPVAGVVALGSSVITVVVLAVFAAEIGKRHQRQPSSASTPVTRPSSTSPAMSS